MKGHFLNVLGLLIVATVLLAHLSEASDGKIEKDDNGNIKVEVSALPRKSSFTF